MFSCSPLDKTKTASGTEADTYDYEKMSAILLPKKFFGRQTTLISGSSPIIRDLLEHNAIIDAKQ
jgi:hypothetical protein